MAAGPQAASRNDATDEARPHPIAVPFIQDAKPKTDIRRLIPALLVAGAFLTVVAIATTRIIIGGGALFASDRSPDHMTERQKDELSQKFYAHGPLALDAVRFRDIDKAIASMSLSPTQEATFREELATLIERDRPQDGARLAKALLAGKVAAATATAAPAATPEAQTPQPAPTPVAAADAEVKLPLAWLTLWDFRDEDGDVVRVVSSGYTRLVPILNQPVTLAVPAPPSGVINVIGVHDGFGGITVGISSGAVPVSLPVLTEGQIIGVPVAVR